MKSNTITNNDIIPTCHPKPETNTSGTMRMKQKKRRLVRQIADDETIVPLPTGSTNVTGFKLKSNKSSTIVNDIWCFNENNQQQQQQVVEENIVVSSSLSLSLSLPLLLLQRERGMNAGNLLIRNRYCQTINWQHRTLIKENVETGTKTKTKSSTNANTNISEKDNTNNNIWRKYCYTCIPFSQLNTPQTDAVLSFDTTGSYIISVGDGNSSSGSCLVDDDTQTHHQQQLISATPIVEEPSLVVRLYGITINTTKMSSVQDVSQQYYKMISSPLVLTIPIAYKKKIRNNNTTTGSTIENEWSMYNSPPSPALFPIRILLSTDNCIGIVITRLWQHEGWTGCSNQVRIVVFPMPSSIANNTTTTTTSSSTIIKTIVLDKIEVDRIGLSKPTNDANLFWIVNYCPISRNQNNQQHSHTMLPITTTTTTSTTTDILEETYSFSTTGTTGNSTVQPVFHTIQSIPSYLFITDEEDGYHLHWFYFQYNNKMSQSIQNQQSQYSTSTNNGWNYVSNLVVDLSSSSSTSTMSFSTMDDMNWDMPQWQYSYSHRLNGSKIQTTTGSSNQNDYGVSSCNTNNNNNNSLRIGASAFLSVKAIVHDLMIRYPKLGNKQCIPKKFTFDIVSVLDNGRIIEIVLVFSSSTSSSSTKTETDISKTNGTGKRKKKDTSIGVFLLIDIFTQRYKEIKWQRSNVPIDEYDVEHINLLAFDQRCKYTGLASTTTADLSRRNTNFDNDNNNISSTSVSLVSLLYPDCQSIDNVAVRKQRPVQCIKSSNAPIELYYG